MKKYDSDFYNSQKNESYLSAKQVIPLILEQYKPNNVVDVGCGVGSWLKAWDEFGVKDYLGIDGEYVNSSSLMIDENKFMAQDLNNNFNLDTHYDLVECLEVAEHLIGDNANSFIKKLTELSDVVLFSAAMPYQGGTNHFNENWLEYWALIFRKFDYVPIDFIRKKIWDNKNIRFWYKQNLMFFVKKEKAHLFKHDPIYNNSLSVIHPEFLLWAASKLKNNLSRIKQDIQYHNDLVSSFQDSKGTLPSSIMNYKNLLPNKKPNLVAKAKRKIAKSLTKDK